jgi:hypothetical protein
MNPQNHLITRAHSQAGRQRRVQANFLSVGKLTATEELRGYSDNLDLIYPRSSILTRNGRRKENHRLRLKLLLRPRDFGGFSEPKNICRQSVDESCREKPVASGQCDFGPCQSLKGPKAEADPD